MSLDSCVEFRDIRVLKHRIVEGFDADPEYVATNRNGVGQAINLAYHLGASRALALGLDCRDDGNGRHWHGDHERRNPDENTYASWIKAFRVMAEQLPSGFEVINCSRKTAVDAFPRMTIEEALA